MKHGMLNARPLDEGMGEAVARRTILRKFNLDGSPYLTPDIKANKPFIWETWGHVAERVAEGNCEILSLIKKKVKAEERIRYQCHLANGSILMSGRHLQHTDLGIKNRNLEILSNCSTANSSFMKFYLLLNGSGVGRCYDDDLMIVDWSKQPFIHVVLDETHPDYDYTCMESLRQVQHKYGKYITVFTVQDSREGWAKALEHLESLIYEGRHENDIIVYDFSKVRPRGSLIGGMQLRPSSGPVPTMNMFNYIKSLKGSQKPIWWQNMYVDHYAAESVLVGGARRAARICVKYWRDHDILDYINIKIGWKIPDVSDKEGNLIRKGRNVVPLWSANNSVGVDEEFWEEHKKEGTWANKVFIAVCQAAYEHGTGEPGFINLHKLEKRKKNKDYYSNSATGRYVVDHAFNYYRTLSRISCSKKWQMIVNPCGEIVLHISGGYCVIGDVAPYHCDTLEEVFEALRLTVRALIRTNLLPCVYDVETQETNRIGVSLTGIHEFAWKFFKLTFDDLVGKITKESKAFWDTIQVMSNVVITESHKCAEEYDVMVPDTCLTIKPAGTTSKLFGLTEGAHLPSMREFVRWVQFRSDDPLVAKYAKVGYKIKKLKQYEGTMVVGFPTQPEICKIGLSKITTAPEATMQQQFHWLQNLEYFWLQTQDAYYGNQISYTLKYNVNTVTFQEYMDIISENQQHVRCCSVMPTVSDIDDASYEYLPEEPVNLDTYNEYVASIKEELEEDIDRVHLECAGGACPIDVEK